MEQNNPSKQSGDADRFSSILNFFRKASDHIGVVQNLTVAVVFIGSLIGFIAFILLGSEDGLRSWFETTHSVPNFFWPIVFIAFVLLVTLWLRQKKIVKSFVSKKNVRRVIVLLPITSKNPDRKVASKSNMDGIGKLVEDAEWKKLVAHFDFRFYDHEGNDRLIHEQLVKEINRSAKYFFCTVSEATLGVIEHFRNMGVSDSICFVCTTAGTSELNLHGPKLIRFYIRIKDEIAYMNDMAPTNHKNIWLIHSEERYGADAQKVFASLVTQGQSITINSIVGRTKSKTQSDSDVEEILVNEIKDEINGRINLNGEPAYVFVAAYGKTMEFIMRALECLRGESKLMDSFVYFTHTATSIYHQSDEVRTILNMKDKDKWKVCVPLCHRLRAGKQQHDTYDENSVIQQEVFTGDVVAEFTYQALRRMLQAIHYSEIHNLNFADIWKTGNYSHDDEITGTSSEFIWKIGDSKNQKGIDSEVKLGMVNTHELTYP